jgi:hypothetical protein
MCLVWDVPPSLAMRRPESARSQPRRRSVARYQGESTDEGTQTRIPDDRGGESCAPAGRDPDAGRNAALVRQRECTAPEQGSTAAEGSPGDGLRGRRRGPGRRHIQNERKAEQK